MFLLTVTNTNDTINSLERLAASQVVWAMLCIALATFYILRSDKNNEKLLNNNEKLIDNNNQTMAFQKEISESLKEQSENQKEMVKTMKDLSDSLIKIEFRVERLEKPMNNDKK